MKPAITKNSSVIHTTKGFHLTLYHWFNETISEMLHREFYHAYKVTITNNNDRHFRLTHRHWEITEAIDKIRIIDGNGVVGTQPVIAPGQIFTYKSTVQLRSDYGYMEGAYVLVECDKDGNTQRPKAEIISLPVPRFYLILPQIAN